MAVSNGKTGCSLSEDLQVLNVYTSLFGISHIYHLGQFLCCFILLPDPSPMNVLFPQYHCKLLAGTKLSFFVSLSMNESHGSIPQTAIH